MIGLVITVNALLIYWGIYLAEERICAAIRELKQEKDKL